ncbi:MAG: PAS domain S-box protein, partial [Thermodesulfobacteriota bacterium]
MNDNRKSKEQLIKELEDLRQQVAEHEKSETERKRAEEALRQSEEKYRSLASTEDSMYFVDRECRYRFMNKAHLLRLDLPLDKVIGRSYSEFHSEEDTKRFTDRVEAVFATGNSFQTEHRSERDNKYFLRTFGPVKDLQGNITDVTVISKDITERKRAEEALIQSEERYRTILDNTQEGYFEVDLVGNFTFVNDAECNDLGYTREELIGMNYKRYTDETAAKKTYELF